MDITDFNAFIREWVFIGHEQSFFPSLDISSFLQIITLIK